MLTSVFAGAAPFASGRVVFLKSLLPQDMAELEEAVGGHLLPPGTLGRPFRVLRGFRTLLFAGAHAPILFALIHFTSPQTSLATVSFVHGHLEMMHLGLYGKWLFAQASLPMYFVQRRQIWWRQATQHWLPRRQLRQSTTCTRGDHQSFSHPCHVQASHPHRQAHQCTFLSNVHDVSSVHVIICNATHGIRAKLPGLLDMSN